MNEKIEVCTIRKDFFSLTIFKQGRIIDQWNFDGAFIESGQPIVNDIQGNTYLYFFLIYKEQVLLNCLNPLENKFIAKNKYVIDFIPRQEGFSCNFIPIIFFDSDKDGIEEFYFYSDPGYSFQPRRVFRYSPKKDTIIYSVKSYAGIKKVIPKIIKNNLKIYLACHAVGNSRLSDPYSDMYSWFMLLDNRLNFIYTPIKTGIYPSNAGITFFSADNKNYLVYLNIYTGTEDSICCLKLFNPSLNLIKEKKFTFKPGWAAANIYSFDGQKGFYIIKKNGQIEKYDKDLNISVKINIPGLSSTEFQAADIDNDDDDEMIFISENFNELIITRKDFSEYTSVKINGLETLSHISIINNGNENNKVGVYLPGEMFLFKYEFNYLYYFKYPLYAGIYLAVLGLVLITKSAKTEGGAKI